MITGKFIYVRMYYEIRKLLDTEMGGQDRVTSHTVQENIIFLF